MSKKIHSKVEKAMKATQSIKPDPAQNKCPLRCWDVFAMLRHSQRDKRPYQFRNP